ncbi:MAG TPA: VTT domain-containing protein [Burkholderiaceae bacterium]|nr:VTT domain-containing protein [Burkholderiaceae bacterium]
MAASLQFVQSLLANFDDGSPLLVAAYVALHVAFAVFFLPCSPFTVIAGALWGVWPGLAISSGAALLASAATFFIGRTVVAGHAARFITRSRFIRRSSEAMKWVFSMGWKSVLLMQGNPLVPASSIGYVFGLTGMNPRTYLVTTYLAALPLQAVLVTSGAMAREAVMLHRVHGYVVAGMCVATGLVAIWMAVQHRLRRAEVAAREEGVSAERN